MLKTNEIELHYSKLIKSNDFKSFVMTAMHEKIHAWQHFGGDDNGLTSQKLADKRKKTQVYWKQYVELHAINVNIKLLKELSSDDFNFDAQILSESKYYVGQANEARNIYWKKNPKLEDNDALFYVTGQMRKYLIWGDKLKPLDRYNDSNELIKKSKKK